MSKIEWTDATWNPIAGCSKVSPGCKNCYAEKMAKRLVAMGQPKYANTVDDQGWTGVINTDAAALEIPLQRRQPTRYFVNSMSDLFHDGVPRAFVDRVFAVMYEAHWHTFQILTKRPERALTYLSWATWKSLRFRIARAVWERREHPEAFQTIDTSKPLSFLASVPEIEADLSASWPLPNVWLGVSAEDQRRWDTRLRLLDACPARVKFVSAEPLLGPIGGGAFNLFRPDCVIVGGESGQDARPMHPDWVRSLRDQAAASDVAFFFKQWGEWAPGMTGDKLTCLRPDGQRFGKKVADGQWMSRVGKKAAGRLLDGELHDAFPGGCAGTEDFPPPREVSDT